MGKQWQTEERMGYPSQKKYTLNDRRFARHFREVERLTKRYARSVFNNILGALALGPRLQQQIRAYRQSISKHYGIGNIYVPHQSEREIARRKRQIERGQLTEANGLVRGFEIVGRNLVAHSV